MIQGEVVPLISFLRQDFSWMSVRTSDANKSSFSLAAPCFSWKTSSPTHAHLVLVFISKSIFFSLRSSQIYLKVIAVLLKTRFCVTMLKHACTPGFLHAHEEVLGSWSLLSPTWGTQSRRGSRRAAHSILGHNSIS